MLAVEKHMSVGESLGMSLLVFAGTAQFAAIDIWRFPLPLAFLFLQTLAINSRHVLMGIALKQWYSRQPSWVKCTSAFFMIDESWALSLAHFDAVGEDSGFLIGSGIAMYLAWGIATFLGSLVAARFGARLDPRLWGLDVALPCVLMTLLVPRWKGLSSALVWIAAGLASALSEKWLGDHHFLAGSNILLGALVGAFVGMSRIGDV
jgi:predicted branched-subunit amino acid permease